MALDLENLIHLLARMAVDQYFDALCEHKPIANADPTFPSHHTDKIDEEAK